MKSIYSLLVSFFLLGMTFVSADIHDTNAQLPDDKQIWPIPKVEMGPNSIRIEAVFKEQKMLISYNQGKWRRDIYIVTYKLKNEDKRFPNGLISFIVRDFNPAKGSGIKMKKLAWHFVKGEKTFILNKDKGVSFRDFYKIVSYTR